MKKLCDNHFTQIGTDSFIQDTRVVTTLVGSVAKTENTTISSSEKVMTAILQMTRTKLGAVVVINDDGAIHRIFTDGDLRRLLEANEGDIHQLRLSELQSNNPVTVNASISLYEAAKVCRTSHVDNLIVTDDSGIVGIADIQDLV
jgi:arabinose-5-phosphate isomerase